MRPSARSSIGRGVRVPIAPNAPGPETRARPTKEKSNSAQSSRQARHSPSTQFKWGAFGYLTGWYGDAKGDRGTDVVEGYYCSQSGEASEKLDGILQAIDLEAAK